MKHRRFKVTYIDYAWGQTAEEAIAIVAHDTSEDLSLMTQYAIAEECDEDSE